MLCSGSQAKDHRAHCQTLSPASEISIETLAVMMLIEYLISFGTELRPVMATVSLCGHILQL